MRRHQREKPRSNFIGDCTKAARREVIPGLSVHWNPIPAANTIAFKYLAPFEGWI
ncbi:hypothetical protein [Rubinisphaera sp.]|uniref:hypothetical protein n=1 Tax=Rubinisphaera sp. TaxID=2024857 RepID=UPI0025FE23A2|nr:hypothetical protein [Rubinisphaera sp.]